AIQKQGTQGWFLAASSRTKVIAKNYSKSALIAEEVSKIIANTYKLNRDQITHGLPSVDIKSTKLSQICPKKEPDYPCHPEKYRSFSGHCNNVENPDWGSSATPYMRLSPAHYADGVALPRLSVTGEELPSSRDISIALHHGTSAEHPHVTTLLVFFGEFVFHDISHSAQTVGYKGHRIKCCGISEELKHPECFPIKVRKTDPLFKDMKQNCIEYVRSCPAVKIGCALGSREQINQVTSFLDGSAIYGSSEEESNLLREFRGGELKSQKVRKNGKERELLPPIDSNQDCRSSEKVSCFLAGDIRVNENVGLTLMHTLWLREHNRIARKLSKLNPNYNDEELFQEARRIVIGELQHVVYNELLPAILSESVVDSFGLRLKKSGFYRKYDVEINPSIGNAVATSVLPFIYSMLPTRFERYSQKLKLMGSKLMSDTYFNPTDLYDNSMFDEYLMGLLSQNANNPDLFITTDMTNSVKVEAREGFDLVAIVLQQGRDHGIPGYTLWRRFCKLTPIVNEFDDLTTVINATVLKRLKKLYKNVHDIDLFTGGLAEQPLSGAIVGPTFACLLGRQFRLLRQGDRFWYENDMPPSSFTKEQLNEIRKSSLASIICNNGDSMDFVQPIIEFLEEFKRNAFSSRIGIASPKSPQGGHIGFLRPKQQAIEISNQSLILELISNNMVRSLLRKNKDRESGRLFSFEAENIMKTLPQIDLTEFTAEQSGLFFQTTSKKECIEETYPCDHTSPFRTITGWCNNLKHPEYGKSMRVFDRFLPPRYEDKISIPRQRSKSGNLLPSPRLISTNIHYDISNPHIRYALITMQWGQFLDHDLTFTPMYMGVDNSILDCKECDSQKKVHPECWPIGIPKNDPFFPASNLTTGKRQCLHFVRSINGQTKLGPREQINQVTAYIDASNVYGSDPCEAKMLRTFVGGKLNVTQHPISGHKDLLPQTTTNPECKAPSGICFEAGDVRSSEQPGLTSMHTIWLREHNRIAAELFRVNPHWNDEKIYQNTRKIISAAMQRITYGEFLPRILGLDYMNKYGLNLLNNGYSNDYDDSCSGTIFNEFASAVFRFGHSLIKPAYLRLGRKFQVVGQPLRLRTAFFNSDMMYSESALDNILRGLITQSVETLDNSITEEVTNHLLEDSKIPFSGMDLISLNLQRARDHGVPPYNEYRVKCNLSRATTFEDLSKDIPLSVVERLKKIYESVDDIDLFTGGISERPVHGGSVGPTFGCVVGEQFRRLKRCDRFWHETSDPFVRFTEAQLSEIRKISLAKVICENADSISTIQRQVMDLPDSFLNPRSKCHTLPTINFKAWRERGATCEISSTNVDVGRSVRRSPCIMCVCTREGPLCNSMRVTNCFNLISSFSTEEILNDSVCKVQCASVFRLALKPNASSSTHTIGGFS
ncbi:Peroxidasin-like protein, partial [Dinothrombium tinctorium]